MNNGNVEAMINSEVGSSSTQVSNKQPITVAQIIKKDLACTSTIQLIADYVVAVQEKTLSQMDHAERDNCLISKVGYPSSFVIANLLLNSKHCLQKILKPTTPNTRT
jgi:hypothetical protein